MDFEDWLEENRDEIEELLRSEPREALMKAWFGGYSSGGSWVADLVKDVYHGKD